PPPRCARLPSTTLLRPRHVGANHASALADAGDGYRVAIQVHLAAGTLGPGIRGHNAAGSFRPAIFTAARKGFRQRSNNLVHRQRSEEHTSELQSREKLV